MFCKKLLSSPVYFAPSWKVMKFISIFKALRRPASQSLFDSGIPPPALPPTPRNTCGGPGFPGMWSGKLQWVWLALRLDILLGTDQACHRK